MCGARMQSWPTNSDTVFRPLQLEIQVLLLPLLLLLVLHKADNLEEHTEATTR